VSHVDQVLGHLAVTDGLDLFRRWVQGLPEDPGWSQQERTDKH
jgi:hypothetical protein